MLCVSLRSKNFIDTFFSAFWRPHFSIWRLKKKFQSPLGACLKKLISDPGTACMLHDVILEMKKLLFQVLVYSKRSEIHCLSRAARTF